MPRQLTTPDRVLLLLSLVPYLLEHGPTTVSELAMAFDVEPKVMRRLVTFLGVAGVPGETMSYQHEDLFDIDWDALEREDVVSLTRVVAVDDTPRFSSAETAALIAGLHELTPMLPEPLRAAAESAARKLATVESVDTRRQAVSLTPPAEDARLAVVSEAIRAKRRLAFEYRDAEGRTSERVVAPLLLAQSAGEWYLRAHCFARGAERTFLVDRMRAPRVGRESAEPFVSQAKPSSPLGIETGDLTATLRLRPGALQRIADFGPTVRSEISSEWLRAEVDLVHPTAAIRLVQAAPGDLVVEAPESARAAVRAWAERALAHYEG